MEDEPRKAPMNAHRPPFRSQVPRRSIEQGDHVLPCAVKRLHLAGFMHQTIVGRGDWRNGEDEAASCPFSARHFRSAGQHPSQQFPRSVGAMRVPTVGRVEDEPSDTSSGRCGQGRGKGGGVTKDDRCAVCLSVHGPFEVGLGPVHHHRVQVQAHGFPPGQGAFNEETTCAGHRVKQETSAQAAGEVDRCSGKVWVKADGTEERALSCAACAHALLRRTGHVPSPSYMMRRGV